jgi:hypothetical protein
MLWPRNVKGVPRSTGGLLYATVERISSVTRAGFAGGGGTSTVLLELSRAD